MTGTGGSSISGGAAGSAGTGGIAGMGTAGAAGQAGGPPLATELALGAFHSCAGFDDGSLRCWGTGGYIGSGNTANIGDDETPDVLSDVDIGGTVRELSAGWYHTCALLDSGALRCFGDGFDGLLGYGNTDDVGDDELPSVAGNVQTGGQVRHVSAGPLHTCVCLQNGRVRCWGSNDDWQLGYPSNEPIGDDEIPASAGFVDVGGSVIQIATGSAHTCALLENGNVRCWGRNGEGNLGYGHRETIGDDETPASAGDVDLGGRALQIVAGSYHTCALLDGGHVRCWGRGGFGVLGYGNTSQIGDDETPAAAGDVDVGGPVSQLSAGDTSTCALTGGAVVCWGSGAAGQLGYGNTENIGDDETPASAGIVPVGGTVVNIDVGFLNTCAIMASGTVRCWGRGSTGALGYGNTNNVGDDETPASAGDVKIR